MAIALEVCASGARHRMQETDVSASDRTMTVAVAGVKGVGLIYLTVAYSFFTPNDRLPRRRGESEQKFLDLS